MESLDISESKPIQSISSYFGGNDEGDIPDMAYFEGQDNIIESDPVCWLNSMPDSADVYNLCACSWIGDKTACY